jgi:hypothetical protein
MPALRALAAPLRLAAPWRALAALCLLLASTVCVGAWVAAPSAALAEQNANPLDWSEYEQKFWEWPFQELSFRVERKGVDIFQITTVREAPEDVFKHINKLRAQNARFHPDYAITGEAYAPPSDTYQITFLKGNLSFLLIIKRDPAGGSELSLQATPMPNFSGYFKRAIYPYRLGNGERVTTYRTDGQQH